MQLEIPNIQVKVMRRAPDAEAYAIYLAAQEWELIDPILIRNRKDLKSEPKWREFVKPYDHQIDNLMTFCRRLPVTLLADDVGLGKTISAGLVASELMSRNRVSKMLVVCPKLLMPQWKEELETKFGIPGIEATGSDLTKVAESTKGGAVITTYQSARSHLEKLSHCGFEMLVLDEAHKLRNLYGTESTPQVALRFREALANRMFKYVLMLTATPIQNRLWDIYSLVDLLSVARGHQNPFGSEGMFARTFISDDRRKARQLAPAMRESFRSVVYQYMSRIRRADANLQFPERVVQLHRVDPSSEENELIEAIAGPIQALNRLAQISILQALVSSPHALLAQLKNMADKGTIPKSLAETVERIVSRSTTSAKLKGLWSLVNKLRAEQPERWRMVIFTTRRETQTTIETFLEAQGIKCGLINGDSSTRNQQTIARFKKTIPEIHVIVSTDAGSEGVNLQVANVLVNFDLPWNPMIVEQRIGRVQRLASEYESVCIFNIILRNTFEEFIVGRLMEKLQMASHAIGDIEALLEASGMDDHGENNVAFPELIRRLVVASLAGSDPTESTRLAEENIASATAKLESQQKDIDAMLGGMADSANDVPYPDLPEVIRSMDVEDFVVAAMKRLGAELSPESTGVYVSKRDGGLDRICFEEKHSAQAVLYQPGSPAFSRLVARLVTTPYHDVRDPDENPTNKAKLIAQEWVKSFAGTFRVAEINNVARSFNGTGTVKVRASVGHDSYERLVQVSVPIYSEWIDAGLTGASQISDPLKSPEAVGVSASFLSAKAIQDQGISAFCQFYVDRRKRELSAAGDDTRKRRKVEDDFTPRVEAHLVSLQGSVHRQLSLRVTFELGTGHAYTSSIDVVPFENKITKSPDLLPCSYSEMVVPQDCLGKCEISGAQVVKHLLVGSEVSGRLALAQFVGTCTATNRRALQDELEESAVTHRMVLKSILRTSELSGKRAEPQFVGTCEFTGQRGLEDELATSEISGKKYRKDMQQRSVVSGKTGYVDEFIQCTETHQPLIANEAEKCDVTNQLVIPGLLSRCGVTGKNVLPSLLEKSSVTGIVALKSLFVSSVVSGARLLQQEAVVSANGVHCMPIEAKVCQWSGRLCHPNDIRTCQVTHLTAHFEYMSGSEGIQLSPLRDLLNGVRRRTDNQEIWASIETEFSRALEGRSQIEAAILSPGADSLAVVVETKSWLGLRTRHSGFLYAIGSREILGKIASGKSATTGWILEKTL